MSVQISIYKYRRLVMRKWESVYETKKTTEDYIIKILSNLLNKTYGLKLGEFNNTTGTKRV